MFLVRAPSPDTQHRDRNVAKLLFIHMLGYPAHFGHMECINLCASPRFHDKRVGYLALQLILEQGQRELMLVTHALQTDMNSKIPYVAGMALGVLGNMATPDMARALTFFVLLFSFVFAFVSPLYFCFCCFDFAIMLCTAIKC